MAKVHSMTSMREKYFPEAYPDKIEALLLKMEISRMEKMLRFIDSSYDYSIFGNYIPA